MHAVQIPSCQTCLPSSWVMPTVAPPPLFGCLPFAVRLALRIWNFSAFTHDATPSTGVPFQLWHARIAVPPVRQRQPVLPCLHQRICGSNKRTADSGESQPSRSCSDKPAKCCAKLTARTARSGRQESKTIYTSFSLYLPSWTQTGCRAPSPSSTFKPRWQRLPSVGQQWYSTRHDKYETRVVHRMHPLRDAPLITCLSTGCSAVEVQQASGQVPAR